MRITIVLLSSLFLLSCEANKSPDESDAVPIQQVHEVTWKTIPGSEQTIYCPQRSETGGQSVVSTKPANPCRPPTGKIRSTVIWIPAAVSILPEDWALPVGGQVQFSHNLEEAPAVFIDWTVNGSLGGNSTVGTIDEQGLYTAPAVIPAANPVAVRATLSSDPGVFSESPVTVTEPPSESGFTWLLWTPRAIDASSPTDPVTLEIGFVGYPNLQFYLWDTQQRINPPGPAESQGKLIESVALHTGVYAFRMSTTEVLADHTEGVLHQFVGILHCDVCDIDGINVGARDFGLGVLALFNDSTVPSVPVSAMAPDIQASSHVANIAVSETQVASIVDDLAQSFYQYFPDSFDFLVFVFPDYTIEGPSGAGGAVQNAITGIGRNIYDQSAQWGSAGRLHGVVQIRRPWLADWTGKVMLHEFGHRWLVFLNEPPVQAFGHWPPGSSFSKGLNRGDPRWQFVHVSANVYQVNCLSFAEVGPLYEYTDIELYLMGLLAPEEVGTHIIFDDPTTMDVCGGQGTATVVTIDDIIATYGARSPDYTESQKDFTMATIILSKDRLLTPHEMAYFNHMAERGERTDLVPDPQNPNELRQPFYLATGGRGTLSTQVLP